MTVSVFISQFDDVVGYDLTINNEAATVQDYLDAMNQFQEKHVAPCKGCDNCCWERIPLTSLDVQKYISCPEIAAQLDPRLPPLSAFVHKFCRVIARGPVLDIILARREDNSCIFLDTENQCCLLHTARSLVCQTFICLPHSEKAGRLRDVLLNLGEDALVRQYLEEAAALGEETLIHENHQAALRIEDYPINAYQEKGSYREVILKDLLPADLWKILNV